MANSFTGTTWFVDTAFAAGLPTLSQVYVKHVVISEATAAGDQVTIKDRAGRTIVEYKAQAANENCLINVEKWADGVQVPTISAATLRVAIHIG